MSTVVEKKDTGIIFKVIKMLNYVLKIKTS